MEVNEIRALNDADLVKQLNAAHKELFELRFRLATKQLVNHRQVRVIKKRIARLNTIVHERELGIRST